MATYTAQQLGITAPSGGFKNEGWYPGAKGGSYQYMNGTFGESGAIHPNSPQQGAGQQVSSETVAQTSPTNVGYLAGGAPTTGSPTTAGSTTSSGAQEVLDNYQQGATGALANLETQANQSDEQILANVKSQLEPTTAQPQAPSMAASYMSFLNSPGLGGTSVNEMNTQLTSLNSQIANVQASLEARQNAETNTGGTVPLGVIAGRQSEEARQAQVQLDSLNLQKGVLVDAINMQMTNINTMMQLTQQDYQNAHQQWQDEFNVNSQIYSAFQSATQFRTGVAQALVSRQDQLAQNQQSLAATNLQTFANLMTSGNITYDKLTPDQKLNITQMETKAGFPVGTLSSIGLAPNQKLLNITSYRGQTTAIIADPNAPGGITTQTFGSIDQTATVSEQKQYYQSQAQQDAQNGVTFQDLMSIYGSELSANEIYDLYNQANYYGRPPDLTAAQLRSMGITQVPYSATQ